MLTAVRAERDELEPVEAVDAPVTARQVRRPKPRLGAVRAAWTQVDRLAHGPHSSRPTRAADRDRLGTAQRGNEEAVAPLDMREGQHGRTHRPGREPRLEIDRREIGVIVEEGIDLTFVLGR